MKFVSAEWVDVPGGKTVKAIGDDGQEYWIGAVTSDVPPWPEFIAEHGEAAITGTPPQEKVDAGA